ncbi:MAG TPA: energy transducer TonB [Blastocatellia bacterium]|nr:energy transducer TonB [Blastocatellia bacterium]
MMKIFAILLTLWAGTETLAQSVSFEKQALTSVQQMFASSLDPELPSRPFQTWLNEVIGPRAGVVWQLTECGEGIVNAGEPGPDLPACAEVNASLPDGRKVIVAITVGTFKKGVTGKPVFFRAVVERDEQLRLVAHLREVPTALFSSQQLAATPRDPTPPSQPSPAAPKPAKRSINLPPLTAKGWAVNFPLHASQIASVDHNSEIAPQGPREEEAPPPPPVASPAKLPAAPQDVAEGILQGKALFKVRPEYPASARKMNALGAVEVQIVISESGKVLDAKAVSGHMALRSIAVKAASQWIFKPTTVNGTPVKVQGILTFLFTPNSK